MNDKQNPSLNYRQAGVDIDKANALIDTIKPIAQKTTRSEVLTGLGGFGALCAIPKKYEEPVLVSGTDGVGTKLKLALTCNRHTGIGIDLVAMCVNDIICHGAEPLYFLDYYATGKLKLDIAKQVIRSIGDGCQQAGCALVGGETAELPGMYHGNDYDLAGFAVGVVERSKLIDGPQQVKEGDVAIGIASSGPHANGYSLIRKIIENSNADLNQVLEGKILADHLLTPTRIYANTIKQLLAHHSVHAIAHITGGGLLENLPRVLPTELAVTLNLQRWQPPAIFEWLQAQGNIVTTEMYRTFNMGVGMVVIVPANIADEVIALINQSGEQAWSLGQVVPAKNKAQVILQ